ncbi:nucleotidyltransferase family protein [Pedobacter nyackensis]|uniref:Poly A polymerase head domain-containing protein n=1 Tax=Pedobacter nyackensis TaxID=475255 RepID=A0A1W2F2X5_9SPHI|nr:hypothetical protein [Pedobacter nyackensis]SMD16260.1 Poly A polymerase head domain-containing protein [Pedobacter nyackensis]
MNPKDIFERLVTDLQLGIPSFSGFVGIVQELNINGVYLAGGAVRDAFLNPDFHAKDLDVFFTPAAFERIHDYLKKHGDLFLNQFGTHRWHAYGDGEFYYDIIVIPEFYNGLWICRNITDALNQFDITANALAFDLLLGSFYDPQNGLLDIQQRILRAVRFDYPEISVSKNIPLSRNTVLWFRYLHYAKKLDLRIESITALWIEKNSFREASIEEFAFHFFTPSFA